MDSAAAIRNQLATAAERGNTLRIIYQGGRQPGTIREIRPLHLSAVEVRAFDVAAGSAKTFLLSKIALPGPDVSVIAYQPPPPFDAAQEGRSLQEKMAEHIPVLRALGWEVTLERDEVTLSYIYAYFKNGKPRRRTPIRLMFNQTTQEPEEDEGSIAFVLTPEGSRIEREPTSCQEPEHIGRPYYLSVQDVPTARTYRWGSSAVATFLAEARRLAPSQP